MTPGLAGKRAIVTAAGSGIGLAIAAELASSGASVLGVDIDATALERLAGVTGLVVDLRDPQSGDVILAAAEQTLGGTDILVNGVGVQVTHEGGFLGISDAQWLAAHDINFLSAVRTCRSIIPAMRKIGGSIVNIGSIAAREPSTLSPDYASAKAALLTLTKSISVEFGPDGVRCNLVAPGPTLTPVFTRWLRGLATQHDIPYEEELKSFVTARRRMALPQAGTPEDVAIAVAFLCSDYSRQITGSELRVDGGAVQSIL